MTWPEVLAGAAGGTVGRPHIAQALIRAGLVATTSEAFGPDWLGERYRLPKEDIDVFRAVRLVRAAGGVPVFAHPRATRRGPDRAGRADRRAGRGRACSGWRPTTRTTRPAERAHVRALAAELGLVVTGSSDFHGTHKTVAARRVHHRARGVRADRRAGQRGDPGRFGLTAVRSAPAAATVDRVNLKLFGEVFVTLLVIIDPPGMVPIFLALTGPLPARDRHRAAWQAVALALGVIVVFAVAGQTILRLPARRPAGAAGRRRPAAACWSRWSC